MKFISKYKVLLLSSVVIFLIGNITAIFLFLPYHNKRKNEIIKEKNELIKIGINKKSVETKVEAKTIIEKIKKSDVNINQEPILLDTIVITAPKKVKRGKGNMFKK